MSELHSNESCQNSHVDQQLKPENVESTFRGVKVAKCLSTGNEKFKEWLCKALQGYYIHSHQKYKEKQTEGPAAVQGKFI